MHCAKCFIAITLFNPDQEVALFSCITDEETEVEFKYFT